MDPGTKHGWFFAKPGRTGGSDRIPDGDVYVGEGNPLGYYSQGVPHPAISRRGVPPPPPSLPDRFGRRSEARGEVYLSFCSGHYHQRF